ncbi:MAG TPA: histidine--tRNA ligase [Anaerolineaceae bacterium]|nr:histidine--tRNA ligase [Anaerolineaceae bacterium]
MAKIVRSVKGTRDFYPEEMVKRQWVYGHLQAVSQSYGYQHYDGPCLETLDLYAAKSGEELVKEQSFVFNDRGGDQITLRPELTPSLARMIAEKQNELAFPVRWWAYGPFWRYERPQRGRTREFFQWNIDLIGSDSVEADAELVAVACSFLRNVGLGPEQVKIRYNDRELMDQAFSELGVNAESKGGLLKLVDRIDKLPADVWDEKVRELGLDQVQLDALKHLLADVDLWKRSEKLVKFVSLLENMGQAEYLAYDPRIIRGLDYYTGIVFEALDVNREFRAILGGGHYGNLVGDVGGDPLPGVGFAMGDVVIQLVLEHFKLIPDLNTQTETIFVTVFDPQTQAESLRIASELRKAGFKVITALGTEKLGKQLKFADRILATKALVIGPDELAKGEVVVKDLRARTQTSLPISQLVGLLRQD